MSNCRKYSAICLLSFLVTYVDGVGLPVAHAQAVEVSPSSEPTAFVFASVGDEADVQHDELKSKQASVAVLSASEPGEEAFSIPEVPSVDERSIDLDNSLATMRIVELSIGGESEGALHHARKFGRGLENGINCDGEQDFCTVYIDGVGITFEYESGSIWSPAHLTGGQLVGSMYGDDGFVFTDAGGGRHTFQRNVNLYMANPRYMRLTRSVYPSGKVVEYNYSWIGGIHRLQSVYNNFGYQIHYEYSSDYLLSGDANLRPSRVVAINRSYEFCAPLAGSCTANAGSWPSISSIYEYGSRIIETVTNQSGDSRRYNYQHRRWSAGSDVDMLFSISSGSKLDLIYEIKNAYSPVQDEVGGYSHTIQVLDGSGAWDYKFFRSRMFGGGGVYFSYPIKTEIRGPSGQYSVVSMSYKGDITNWVDANGGVTEFIYGSVYGSRPLVAVVKPDRQRVEFTHDERGNVLQTIFKPKPGVGLSDLSTASSFPVDGVLGRLGGYQCANWVVCNRPLSVTTTGGSVTTNTYDPVHGGVLTQSGPMVNGVRLVKRYSYTQRRAWILAEHGGYVPLSPIWMLAEERICRTTQTIGNSCAGGSGDEVLTTYDYGPEGEANNLDLRGIAVTAEGQTLRTCYAYDRRGNRIAEVAPQANLASCS